MGAAPAQQHCPRPCGPPALRPCGPAALRPRGLWLCGPWPVTPWLSGSPTRDSMTLWLPGLLAPWPRGPRRL